jgi:hypothetical protein
MGGLLRDNLEPTDFADADCRITDWNEFGYHGRPAYRIWFCICNGHKFQRHEWQIEGRNSTELEDWIYLGMDYKAKHSSNYVHDWRDVT